jgi:hypothetical protein
MIAIKLIIAVLLLILILAGEVGAAHVLDLVGTWALQCLRKIFMELMEFMERKKRRKRLKVLLILLYRFVGKRSNFVVVCALFAWQVYLMLTMRGATGPERYILSAMGVVAAAMVTSFVLLHPTSLYRWFYTSHFAKGTWAIVAAAAAWYGHSLTKSELNWAYGVAGPQLSAAFQVGTFIRTFGILSLLLAIPTLLMEIGFMATMFDGRKYGKTTKGRRLRTLIATIVAFYTVYMGMRIAVIPAANSGYIDAVLADVAWLADTYPDKACTGIEQSDIRRIVFTNGSASDALVFEAPTISPTPLIHWQKKDVESAQMKLVDLHKGCAKFVETPSKTSIPIINKSGS